MAKVTKSMTIGELLQLDQNIAEITSIKIETFFSGTAFFLRRC